MRKINKWGPLGFLEALWKRTSSEHAGSPFLVFLLLLISLLLVAFVEDIIPEELLPFIQLWVVPVFLKMHLGVESKGIARAQVTAEPQGKRAGVDTKWI